MSSASDLMTRLTSIAGAHTAHSISGDSPEHILAALSSQSHGCDCPSQELADQLQRLVKPLLPSRTWPIKALTVLAPGRDLELVIDQDRALVVVAHSQWVMPDVLTAGATFAALLLDGAASSESQCDLDVVQGLEGDAASLVMPWLVEDGWDEININSHPWVCDDIPHPDDLELGAAAWITTEFDDEESSSSVYLHHIGGRYWVLEITADGLRADELAVTAGADPITQFRDERWVYTASDLGEFGMISARSSWGEAID